MLCFYASILYVTSCKTQTDLQCVTCHEALLFVGLQLNEYVIAHLWHDQGEWVTCRQNSVLTFQYKWLVHSKNSILIQTPSKSDIWLQRYEQFFNSKNNVIHKNLPPFLACYSKSIFPTSDSFPLIMSHFWNKFCHSESIKQQWVSDII